MTALRNAEERSRKKTLTREDVVEALREYVSTYGEVPTTAAFNPSTARWRDAPELVERYRTPRKDGSAWPSLNAIKDLFDGKFNAALVTAGFPPNKPGPGRRRPRGKHAPIRDVRTERVYVPSEPSVWLKQQLEKAERRALRAEQRLEEAKARVVVHEVRDDVEIEKLRERLADEKARRKQVQRELNNAERREARVRASGARGTLREVDRLTDRLAAAEALIRELKTRSPAEAGDRRRVPPTEILVTAPQAGFSGNGTDLIVPPLTPEGRVPTVSNILPQVRTVHVPDEKALRRAERAESRLEGLRAELRQTTEEKNELAERLAAMRRDALVDALATRKVQSAERRAADAERKAEELAVLAVGERRQLTLDEMKALRTDGPSGPAVLKRAIKRLARSEGSYAQKVALHEVAEAAVNWSAKL